MTPERWAVLQSLFDRALSLSELEREGFVDLACSGDRALRDSLVALLHHNEVATSVLAGPMLTPGRVAEIVSSGLRTFVPGEVVAGRFRVERFIAEGGMGEVYAAEDLELEERVALKTIRPLLANDEKILARFKQEIQLARRVTNRHVSRIFDLFRHEMDLDGEHRAVIFVSMELLEGETLLERIRHRGALPFSEAQVIASQIIAGLEAAHSAGIVHSDLKSSNIALVAEREGGERAVIMDFGLAGTAVSLKSEVRDGLIGTPAYMAPEQVENGLLTPATDVYSLGVVLYEMVSAQLPFNAATYQETARARLERDAPPLSAAVPKAPVAWQRTIAACLQKDPAKRPVSAAQVRGWLEGSNERRARIRTFAAAIFSVALIASGWVWLHQPHRPSPEAQAAVDAALVKLPNRTPVGFRDAIKDLQRAMELDPKWAEPWAEIAYAYADAANTSQIPAAVAHREARKAALEALRLDGASAKALGVLGWVQSFDFEEWPKAEGNLRQALSLNPNDPRLYYWLGVHLRKTGKFAEAELEDRRAMTLSHETDPTIWCEIAFLYWTSGRLDRMEEFMRDLLVAYPNFGLARFLNARLLKEQGRFEEALSELRFSESLQYSPVTVLAERTSVEAYRGDRQKAGEDLRTLEKTAQSGGPVDGLLIAGVYARLGDFDQAFAWLERAYSKDDSTLLSIYTSPVLQPLRKDPRFQQMLQRLHYPH